MKANELIMVNRQQRNQLAELIRHLASGTVSVKKYKGRREEIFGNEADFEDLEDNDDSAHDITAIILSCEAMELCEQLRKQAGWRFDLFKSKPKDKLELRREISLICLFLYSDLKDMGSGMPQYKYDALLGCAGVVLFFGIAFGGIIGGAFLMKKYLNDTQDYYCAMLLGLLLVLTFVIIFVLSEYTQYQNRLLIDRWKKESFFKYPFVTQADYEKAAGACRLLGQR